MLAQSIEAAKHTGVIKASSARRMIVDTTVMPKAIAYPSDLALLECGRATLVKMAQQHGLGLGLRQNYNRVAPRLVRQIGRYAHARQYKRMHATIRLLRTRRAEHRPHADRKQARPQLAQGCIG